MTGRTMAVASGRAKATLWFAIASAVLLLVAANWHLVHVAMTSAPDCVAHVRPGDGPKDGGRFSAASSSCTPP